MLNKHFLIVISQKVNMAARLMIKFPNAVTCDEATKIKSKLPEEDFTEQPTVVLKGIADPGSIFAYSTVKYVMCVCVCWDVCWDVCVSVCMSVLTHVSYCILSVCVCTVYTCVLWYIQYSLSALITFMYMYCIHNTLI